jgi:L-aminoadipate-semialdehyde dehydrogenase
MSGESDINSLLARLELAPLNPGAWSGQRGWMSGSDAPILSVRNPATGALIAQVRPAGREEYESVIASAVETAAAWRAVPAPKRGEVVRLIGEELRRAKADPALWSRSRTARSSPKAWARCRR